MSTFALWRLFHRPGSRGSAGHTSMLAIIAFAAATTIFLTVLGGVHGFIWRASADHTVACAFDFGACRPDTVAAWKRQISDPTSLAQFSTAYVALAVFACMLLVVPFVALAGSAARLAASRRDARLAALRLAGATTGQVVRLTALDAAGQALIGALIGIAGYCALMPAVMLIPFQEQRFTFEQLWVGPLALVITLAGVAILALISSLVTLRRVAITPLGVTSRTATALPSGTRMVLFVVVVVVAMIVFKNPAMLAQAGQAVMYGVIIGFMLLCFALVNLIGTWVITARAKAKAKRPKDAATMIAMRRILDNPKRAWRNVSGIALAVFIAGITSICGFFGSAAVVDDANDPFTVFIRDIGTGGILTLVFAAVLAAVFSVFRHVVFERTGIYFHVFILQISHRPDIDFLQNRHDAFALFRHDVLGRLFFIGIQLLANDQTVFFQVCQLCVEDFAGDAPEFLECVEVNAAVVVDSDHDT